MSDGKTSVLCQNLEVDSSVEQILHHCWVFVGRCHVQNIFTIVPEPQWIQLQLGKAAVKLALLSSFFNPGGVTFCASSPNSLFADVDVIDQFGELLDHSLGKLKRAGD